MAGGIAQYLIEETKCNYDIFIGTSTGSLLVSHLALGKILKLLLHFLWLFLPRLSCEGNKAEIIIGKQRNGPIGKVNLTFLKEYTRFEDFAVDSYYDSIQ